MKLAHSIVDFVLVRPEGCLYCILLLLLGWLALGIAGLIRPHRTGYIAHLLFPLGAVVSLGVALVAGTALARGPLPQTMTLPLGLPDLPFYLRLDTLFAFFFFVLGLCVSGRRRVDLWYV